MAFWKPGTAFPGAQDRAKGVNDEVGMAPPVIYNPNARMTIQQQRLRLPIYAARVQFLYLVEKYSTVIVVGSTGSGKTTQVPQYLVEAGWAADGRCIAVTQPRRVAAMSVAARVAEEMNVELGTKVGYCIRFDDQTKRGVTSVKYLTDGVLLREMMGDPLLVPYSVIVLDEAHERSVNTDILLGLIKKVQRKRPDLRVIVSSATLDCEVFRRHFNTNETSDPLYDTVAVLPVEGRLHPVDVLYVDRPVDNYMGAALHTVLDIHEHQPPGDILVFLTGRQEIEELVTRIGEEGGGVEGPRGLRLVVLPLYASLSAARQMKVFDPPPKHTRKVIVATNLAETSVTIQGVVYVVDTGFVKIRAYNSKTGVDALIVTPISQASAQQRAGRAGRTRPGKCYRLYREAAFHGEGKEALAKYAVPEIQRCDLTGPLLLLKSLGIDDVLHFDFVSPPSVESMARSLELLYALGALDDDARLTRPVGIRMAEMPVAPMMARALLVSGDMRCSEEMLSIAAMLSVEQVFRLQSGPRGAADAAHAQFAAAEGDHLTLLNVYAAYIKAGMQQRGSGSYRAKHQQAEWCEHYYINARAMQRAVEIREQLAKFLRRFKVPLVSCGRVDPGPLSIQRALVCGYFSHAAHWHPSGEYRTVRDNASLAMHPTSVYFFSTAPPEYVLFHDVVQTDKLYARELCSVDPSWLPELAPHYYESLLPKSIR